MYNVSQIIITKHSNQELYEYCDKCSKLAKNLRNATLFRIRQNFMASGKSVLSENEQQVQDEIKLLEAAYPVKVKKVISYLHLEKLLRVTRNPDFFAGLPMQTSQAIVKAAVSDFKNWLAALKAYKKEPDRFISKPKMPKYSKSDAVTFTITNQDAVFHKTKQGLKMKLPGKLLVPVPHIPEEAVLKEVKVKPYYDSYLLLIVTEIDDVPVNKDFYNISSVDFGIDNIVASVMNDGTSLIYKGGAIKSKNQWFNKEKARLTGILTKGHTNKKAYSKRIQNLCKSRDLFLNDQLHKISRSYINECIKHKVGTIILGVNKKWKQSINIGDVNNQNFVQMPFAKLRWMITYKAQRAGILVLEQEESYTSKADFLSDDVIPVYGNEDGPVHFSGKRIKRGLYQSKSGTLLNADLNGAANIMRKAVPDSMIKLSDFSFLNKPDVYGFHRLNPKGIPVKRIEAV